MIDFFQFNIGALYSTLSLSHPCGHLKVLGALLEECGIVSFGERRKRKSRKSQEDTGISSYNVFFLQVSSCMYDFLYILGMHGICMWLFGYDLSLAWRIAWIDNGFYSIS